MAAEVKYIPVLFITLACFPWAITGYAASPSFDCKTTKTTTEKTICESDDLSALDKKVADVYEQLMHSWTGPRQHGLAAGQKTWLRLRDMACEPAEHARLTHQKCLKHVISVRLKELKASASIAENEVTFTQPLKLEGFPYAGHVVNPDVESLLDLPVKKIGNEPVGLDWPITMVFAGGWSDDDTLTKFITHTCREWLVLTSAGWGVWSILYPYNIAVGLERTTNATCKSVEALRNAQQLQD